MNYILLLIQLLINKKIFQNKMNYSFSYITLKEIKENINYKNKLNEIIKNIISSIGFATLEILITEVHLYCPELKCFCDENKDNLKITSANDKGAIGKLVEFYLFGNLPNNNHSPDMCYGDIKTTHFKMINNKNNNLLFNAKERLTITNFGDPNNETNIEFIKTKNNIMETKYYDKIKIGILFVLQYEKIDKNKNREPQKYNTIESLYQKKILGIIHYDLDYIFEINSKVSNIFQEDFDKIKKCILENKVSQKGQKYLHIHKHGTKNTLTRAFGFTNKFLTLLVSIYLNLPLITKGRSDFILYK